MRIQSFRAALCVSAAVVIVMQAGAVQAAGVRYEIEAGEASHTLSAFARQAGLQLVAPSSDLQGQRTAALQGEMPVEQALETMLRGTSLSASISNGTIIVRKSKVPRPVAHNIALPPAAFGSQASGSVEGDNAAPATASAGLEEIIVTATRREERLSDVPIAVTAMTAQALESRQINDISTLQMGTPSLYAAPFGDSTSQIVAIRGQIASDIVVSIDPAVGIYMDGVYIARATGGNMSFVDVDRVEVLRGPQGTLFGRNTIGGAINIATRQPTDAFEGKISATYGNFDRMELTGVVNVPLGDTMAARVVYSHRQRDGFARSSLTGASLGAENVEYARGAFRWDVAPDWKVTLAGDFTHSRNAGQWLTLLKTYPTADAVAAAASDGTDLASNYVDPFDRTPASQTRGPNITRNWGVSGTVEGGLGAATFKSITSYRKVRRLLQNMDQDGSPFELLQQPYNDTAQDQFSQELQLFGKAFDNRLDWIIGAYYFTEHGRDIAPAHFDYPLLPTYGITDGEAWNKSYAAYAQATYSLTDRFQAVAGIRYTRDKRRITLYNRTAGASLDDVIRCNTVGATLPTCAFAVPNRNFSYVPFTVGLNYKPASDLLFYAKWSRGFRAGGFNVRGSSNDALAPFDPEKVNSYELGGKLEAARIFRLNFAFYLSKFDDIQFSTVIPTSTGTTATTQNAGKATIKGAEVEATAALGSLTLSGNMSITDARYDKLNANVTGVTLNSPFILTPELTWALVGDYRIPTGFGSITLHGDYSYRSRVYFAASPPADPMVSQGGYGIVNASISAKLDSGLTLSAWGRNLAKKKYIQRVTNLQSIGFLNAYPGDPRTYGVSASFEF